MRITPGRVHDERSRVLTNCFSERFGTVLDNDVSPTDLAWYGGVERRSIEIVAILKLRDDDSCLQAWFAL